MVRGGGGVDGDSSGSSGPAESPVEDGAGVGGTKALSIASFMEATNSLALSRRQYLACPHSSMLRWMAGSTNKSNSWESKRMLFQNKKWTKVANLHSINSIGSLVSSPMKY